MILIFPSLSVADEIMNEIACTPVISGGIGAVWTWQPADSTSNRVSYNQAVNGRIAVAHPWPEVDQVWLKSYIEDNWPTVQYVDTLPGDWYAS